jgi:hypothetical protein
VSGSKRLVASAYSSLHVLDASTWQLHRVIFKVFDLGGPRIVDVWEGVHMADDLNW